MRSVFVLLLLLACGGREVVVVAPTRPAPVETPVVMADPPPPSQHFESRTIGATEPTAHYRGRPIDLDLKDADIGNVCRLLADVGRVNIVLGDGVQGQVTLRMRGVPWDQALEAVIQAKGLRAEREGNVILLFAK